MKIGYARVSSTDQDFDGQVERLKAAGCERVFSEKVSGKALNGRGALQKALSVLGWRGYVDYRQAGPPCPVHS
jgi:DNA invertase Pin-like site-specific DNA recombinase